MRFRAVMMTSFGAANPWPKGSATFAALRQGLKRPNSKLTASSDTGSMGGERKADREFRSVLGG
jgi:hypothetical protein